MYCESWFKPIIKSFVLSTAICCSLLADNAQAGPLIDWLFGRRNTAPAYPVGQAVPMGNGYSAGYGVYPRTALSPPLNYRPNLSYGTNYGAYYGSQLPVLGNGGAAYAAPAPSGISAATLPSTLSYVPNFRTNSYRAPVTYYRPLMTTDPSTGSQVVAMAPCTSYEYQASRDPALGRSALYGPSLVPQQQAAPQTVPTYTLPSGGIPLASNYPTTSYNAPYTGASPYAPSYSSSYGGYSALQPSTSYPASPYYGGVSGGSTGSYVPPAGSSSLGTQVPGLSAPQAGTIRRPAPTYGQVVSPPDGSGDLGSYPGSSSDASGVYPDPSVGGSDPRGDVTPSLNSGANARSFPIRPRGGSRESQFAKSYGNQPQSIESMEPIQRRSRERSFAANRSEMPRPVQRQVPRDSGYAYDNSKLRPIESSEVADRGLPGYPKVDVPSLSSDRFESSNPFDAASEAMDGARRLQHQMDAIPVPDSFEVKPRWNPGLLREEDMTALRPIAPEIAQYAGQGKKIHWASFEDRSRSVARPVLPAPERATLSVPELRTGGQNFRRHQVSESTNSARPSTLPQSRQVADVDAIDTLDTRDLRLSTPERHRSPSSSPVPAATKSRYSTQGWKSSR